MKAMILAAGRGRRMRPLTDHTPKPLLRVGGKPLIVWHIERLAAAGYRDIVINHAWLGEQIPELLGDGSSRGVRIHYSAEGEQALETGGGIHRALPLLGDAPFLVINGDVWTDMDFALLPASPDGLAHLVLVPNPAHNPAGDFSMSEGRLGHGKPKYTYSGVGIFRPELFAGCTGGAFPLAPLLRQAISGPGIGATLHEGRWFDIGTPERLEVIDRLLVSRPAP